jgi:CubicO group peptidase (beta-lactamase class C family)
MLLIKYSLLFTAFFFSSPAFAQKEKVQLAKIMQTYHQYNMFDGAVLVAYNDRIVYKDAFGLANREWNIPNSPDTKFMIGSVSKPLTAMLALIQVQKGFIDRNKTIADYLPEFQGKPAGKATIKQLMSHTAGIANYDIIPGFFPDVSRQNFSREKYIRLFMDSALAFQPGTGYSYSSWGYFTLGYLLERVTGKTYAELMKQDIYDKLQMNHSGSYYHTQIVPQRATGYDYSFGGFSSSDFRDQSNTMGTGDIYSTVEDLYKFHRAIENHSLIGKELTDEMLTPGERPAQYGYGWFNKKFKYSDKDSVAANFHLGMTEGFISFILRIPESKSFVVILCNSSPTDFFGIVGNLVKVLYKKPVHIRKPVHKEMEMLINKVGALKAVQEYQRMKVDTDQYYVDWISMNFIAEQLLTMKRLEDAKIIAENNAKEFPDKDLVMVTMGNIYLRLNRKDDAIEYYRRALKIYPGYEEAKTRLRELGAL